MSENHSYELQSGTLLNGRYKIQSNLDSGGFGITYMAEDTKLSRLVCVKELFISGHCTRGTGNTVQSQGLKDLKFSDFRNRFLEEARRLARFEHPGIVSVQDVFEENGTAYYAMKFIEGESLQKYIQRQGKLQIEEALAIMQKLLDAVEVLHQSSPPLLHRDIKPGNIMLRSNGNPVLIDFGNAREYREGMSISQSGIMLTPGYAPPEQYQVKTKRGAYTDIYAIGATMYMMLTGTIPSAVAERSLKEIAAPRELNPAIPEGLSASIMNALALKPEDRYQSVGELREALKLSGVQSAYDDLNLTEANREWNRLRDETIPVGSEMKPLISKAEKLLNKYSRGRGELWERWNAEVKQWLYLRLRELAGQYLQQEKRRNAEYALRKCLLYLPGDPWALKRLKELEGGGNKHWLLRPQYMLAVIGGMLLVSTGIWFYYKVNIPPDKKADSPQLDGVLSDSTKSDSVVQPKPSDYPGNKSDTNSLEKPSSKKREVMLTINTDMPCDVSINGRLINSNDHRTHNVNGQVGETLTYSIKSIKCPVIALNGEIVNVNSSSLIYDFILQNKLNDSCEEKNNEIKIMIKSSSKNSVDELIRLGNSILNASHAFKDCCSLNNNDDLREFKESLSKASENPYLSSSNKNKSNILFKNLSNL